MLASSSRAVIGPLHAYPVLTSLVQPWRRHLPLLEAFGNFGSPSGDVPADARYTEAALNDLGALALAAERGDVGPVPFGLVDGTWYRGGLQPPYEPAAMVTALRTGVVTGLVPSAVTGGPITGDLAALAAGHPTRLVLGSTITYVASTLPTEIAASIDPPPRTPSAAALERQFDESKLEAGSGWWAPIGSCDHDSHSPEPRPHLVITAVPYGVPQDDVTSYLERRARAESGRTGGYVGHYLPKPTQAPAAPVGAGSPIADLRDETSGRTGLRIVVVLRRDVDPDIAREWVESTWPVTITQDAQLPASLAEMVRGWDPGDGSGLDALERLLSRR